MESEDASCQSTKVGTNAVCPNPLYGSYDHYCVGAVCACKALVESGTFAVTSSDIKGFEACIGASENGEKAYPEIGDKITTMIDDGAAGNYECPLSDPKNSFNEAKFGDCTSTDDGSSEPNADKTEGMDTHRMSGNVGDSGEYKGANTFGADTLSFVAIECDCEDTTPGRESGTDVTVVLPTCDGKGAEETCQTRYEYGCDNALTHFKTERVSGTENPDDTSVYLSGATAVCGDSGTETLFEKALYVQKQTTCKRNVVHKFATMVIQTSDLTTCNLCLMCVEANDAVNVTTDGMDRATSLGEMVVGKHFAEVAKTTVLTRCEIEQHSEECYNHYECGGACDANGLTGPVVAIMVNCAGVKRTSMFIESGCMVCSTLNPCFISLTPVALLYDEMACKRRPHRGAMASKGVVQGVSDEMACQVSMSVKDNGSTDVGDSARAMVGDFNIVLLQGDHTILMNTSSAVQAFESKQVSCYMSIGECRVF